MARLIDNSYGKSEVRLSKVVRTGSTHTLFEFAVQIMLGGAFERLYTQGDNSLCVPTDTMKNTVFALAKKSDFASPEEFAAILVDHFLDRFDQVAWAEVSIRQTLWARIPVGGKPHDFAFTKGGSDSRTARVRAERGGELEVTGGLTGLEILKSSGSSFVGFLKDEYTTLPEASDRIFATTIDATWTYAPAASAGLHRPNRMSREPAEQALNFNSLFEEARRTILELFATHDSKSVQQTIYAIGEAILARQPAVSTIDIAMPNQHRLLVNLAPFGLENANEIFVATSEPFGIIKGSVARE